MDYCYSSPLYFLTTVSFIVTKDGEVKNVRQVLGNFDLHCPYTLMILTKKLVNLELNPAILNKQKVSSLCFLGIDMDSNCDFFDEEEIKNKYTKIMKKNMAKKMPSMYTCN